MQNPTAPPIIVALEVVTIPNPLTTAAAIAEMPDAAAAMAAARAGNRAAILAAWPGIVLGNASKPEALMAAVEKAMERFDRGEAIAALATAPDAPVFAVGACIFDPTTKAAERLAIFDPSPRSPFDSPDAIFAGERAVLADLSELLAQTHAERQGAVEVAIMGPPPKHLTAWQRVAFRAASHGVPMHGAAKELDRAITSLAQWVRCAMRQGTPPPPSRANAQRLANEAESQAAAALLAERAECIARIAAALRN